MKWSRAVANEMIENLRNSEDESLDLDNSYTTNFVNLIYDQQEMDTLSRQVRLKLANDERTAIAKNKT